MRFISAKAHFIIFIAIFNRNSWFTYENNTYGIKIIYPYNWEKEEILSFNIVVLFRQALKENSNSRSPVLIISIENLTSYNMVSLDQFVAKQISNLTQSPSNYKIIESIPTTLGRDGNAAHKIVYGGISVFDKRTINGLEVCIIKDDKAYVITSFTEANEYSKHISTIERMIDSFEMLR